MSHDRDSGAAPSASAPARQGGGPTDRDARGASVGPIRTLSSGALKTLDRPGVGPIAFLLVITAVMAIVSPGFIAVDNWYFMVNESVFVLLVAIGMTVVLIGGGIDLSVGSTIALAATLSGRLMRDGLPMPAAFAIALGAGAAVGCVNGVVITRLRIPDFVTTIATMTALRGILMVWTSGDPVYGYSTEIYASIGGLRRLAPYLSVPIVVGVIVAVAFAVMMRRTKLGRHMHAVGGNQEASRLTGIRVARVKVATYAVSGALAAVSGILLAGRLAEVQPGTAGSGYELTAIAAAIMGGATLSGGRGSVGGACVGAIVMTVITSLIQWWSINPVWTGIIAGALILMTVILQRAGSAVALGESRKS